MKEDREKRYSKIIKIVLIALVVVTAAVIGIRMIINNQHEVTDNRPLVKVNAPEKREVCVYTEQIGTVQPAESVNIMAMMAGEVLEVNFEAGDEVKEGQLLMVINSDSLKTVGITVESAEIQMNDAQTNLERMQVLFASGAISQAALEQAQSGAEAAKLAYESAKEQYDIQTKYSHIKAPISGVVEYKNAKVHDFVTQGMQVASIKGKGVTSVAFGVSEDSLNAIKQGDPVTVFKDGYEGSGHIVEVNRMIGQNGLYNAKAELDNADGLTTNSKVVVRLLKNHEIDADTIPLSAIYHDGGDSFVYVLKDDNTIEKRNVTVGIDDGEYVVIKDGLTSKDNVVYTWSRELYNGAEVVVDFDAQ